MSEVSTESGISNIGLVNNAVSIKRERDEADLKQEMLMPFDSLSSMVAVRENNAKKLKISEKGLLIDAVKRQLISKKIEKYKIEIRTLKEKIDRQSENSSMKTRRKKKEEFRIFKSSKKKSSNWKTIQDSENLTRNFKI